MTNLSTAKQNNLMHRLSVKSGTRVMPQSRSFPPQHHQSTRIDEVITHGFYCVEFEEEVVDIPFEHLRSNLLSFFSSIPLFPDLLLLLDYFYSPLMWAKVSLQLIGCFFRRFALCSSSCGACARIFSVD